MRKNLEDMSMVIHEAPEDMSMTEEMGLHPGTDSVQSEAATGSVVQTDELLAEDEIKGILESLLYVSHDPLTLDKLASVFEGQPKTLIHQALRSLQRDYDADSRGLRIAELAGGFVMVTRQDCAPWITKLQKAKASPKVSRSALETLAIVAYKQPIVRAEIEQIRGVECSGVLRTLLDQKLLRIVGRQDVPGRPIMYGTSKVFLQRFGLRDVRDLPPLREFKELGEPTQTKMFAQQDEETVDGTDIDGSPDSDHGIVAEEEAASINNGHRGG